MTSGWLPFNCQTIHALILYSKSASASVAMRALASLASSLALSRTSS